MTDINGNGIPDETEGNVGALTYYQQQLAAGGYMVPQLGSGGTQINPDDPLVYLGTRNQKQTAPRFEREEEGIRYLTSGTAETASVSQMFENLDNMSIKEQHNLYTQLLVAGYSSSTVPLDKIAELVTQSSFIDLVDSYTIFLKELSDRYSTRNQEITPDELLKQRISYRFKQAGIEWDGNLNSLNLDVLIGEDDLSGTRTSTYTSKDFMDPMDAKSLVRATLQRELGRDPTTAEYEDFVASIHAAEARDPSRTTQTTTTDSEGRVVTQNSVTQQGMTQAGIGQLALEKAQRNPDWAEWLAMGTYAPALFAALGSTVPGT